MEDDEGKEGEGERAEQSNGTKMRLNRRLRVSLASLL